MYRLLFLLISMAFLTTSMVASSLTATQKNGAISVVVSFLLSGDGGKSVALDKVSQYAQTNGSSSAPTLDDYDDIGLTSLEERVVAPLNHAIIVLNGADVDSTEELQAILDQLLQDPPVITLRGNDPTRLGLGSRYVEDGADANDSIDGDISDSVIITGSVNTSQEGNYTLLYNITDSDGNSATEVNRSVQVSGTADTTPPAFSGVISDYNVTVEENQLFAIDLNATDDYSIRYMIQDGNSTSFNVNSATGVVTFKQAPDYESGLILYTFTAIASDGEHNETMSVTINISDVDDIAPEFDSEANVTVDENEIDAIELSASDTTSYRIEGGDASAFNINSTTGEVTFKEAPDYESGKTLYTFTAIASDGINETEQEVRITIADIDDEQPTWSVDGNQSVNEEQLSVMTLVATDVDTPDANIRYHIKDGNSSYFSANSITGEVTFNAKPDYESGVTSYTFTATADDGVNDEVELTVWISLVEIFEEELKKTAQILSYDESGIEDPSIKDDGNYQAGQLIDHAYSRSDVGVVSDHITRLEWEDNSSVSRSWSEAGSYCSSLALDGGGWRLPTYNEMESLLEYELGRSVLVSLFNGLFQSKGNGDFWTATQSNDPNSPSTTHAWIIDFFEGDDAINTKSSSRSVKCVRDASNRPVVETDFEDLGDVVNDNNSNLQWQDNETAATLTSTTWEGAISHCEALSLNGADDWRLPNIRELKSIVNRERAALALYVPAFANIYTDNDTFEYWSATSTKTAGTSNFDRALSIEFVSGKTTGNPKTESKYVRCVREKD
jgi:hypothetical protein